MRFILRLFAIVVAAATTSGARTLDAHGSRASKFVPRATALNVRGGGEPMLHVAWDDTPIKGKGEEYEVPNLLFAGMVRHLGSEDAGGSAVGVTAVGVLALACKLTLAYGMLRTHFLGALPLGETWAALGALDPSARWAMGAALVVAPAFLIKSYTEASELKDSAVFYATLRSLRGARHSASSCFWLFVHVLRSYVLLPLFVLANAAVMASTSDFGAVLGSPRLLPLSAAPRV